MSDRNVIWTPQPKQAMFLSRPEYEAIYGGSAGGGKSETIVIEPLRQVHIPHFKALILRKTFPQLTELIQKSMKYYPACFPGAKYNSQAHTWTFPSGARVQFGSLNHPQDKIQYQGIAYDLIIFDELTHFTWDEYSYLLSRNRPNGPGTRVYMRSTANPGGIGHGWVKERWHMGDADNSGKTIWEAYRIRYPDGHWETKYMSRVCIRATLFDNKILLDNDPDYVTRLAMMDPAERDALLYGDWNRFEGQAFTEWQDNPDHYIDRVATHVIKPFRVPDHWPIWCGLDWGYSRPFSVGWYAIDQDRRMYRIAEYYGCNGTPNVGVKLEPAVVARKIREIEATNPNLKGKRIHRVGDPAIWQETGTESIGGLMEHNRVFFEKGKHDRMAGKMQCHHRLQMDENGIPMFYCFSSCHHFIRTVPALVYSQTHVEDIDTDGEDHIYDEWRYVCMENPIAAKEVPKKKVIAYSPLDTDEDLVSSPYEYMLRY